MSNVTPITPTLEKTVTRDGHTITIQVYKADQPKAWILEVVDEFGGSVVWDNTFPTPQLAMQAALQAIEEEGIEAFIEETPTDPDSLPTLNRFAITITAKQAFVDWINSLDADKVTLAEVNEEASTYMVDVDDDMNHNNMDGFLRPYFTTIFEEELAGWYLDEAAWPQNRDWALFCQFFHYSISSVVYDLGKMPVEQI